MKNITFTGLIAVPLMAFAWAIPAWADDAPATTCKDGTTTTSTGKGTCSGHGGVQKGSAATPAASTPATVPVQAPPGAPSAVTTCKDGTTSTSSGKGYLQRSWRPGEVHDREVDRRLRGPDSCCSFPRHRAGPGAARGTERGHHLQRRHHQQLDWQGHLQRSWRSGEIHRTEICRGNYAHTGR